MNRFLHIKTYLIIILFTTFFNSCKKENSSPITHSKPKKELSYHEKYLIEISKIPTSKFADTTDMALVSKGNFLMGGVSNQARGNELPQHQETVKAFYIDKYEVTNDQFKQFIEATKYITTAEREIVLEGKIYPPGALVFNANDIENWWSFIEGANWKHPYGPKSSIEGKENHPVVQVSWYDAMAYAHWANKSLPTEIEYEYASRGKLTSKLYPWGNDYNQAHLYANFFQGKFPSKNLLKDKQEKAAQVGSYLPNSIGIHDISGNVWEWCLDTYHVDAYSKIEKREKGYFKQYHNPKQQKVMRGGSYLCNESYCTGYRSSARMSSSPDTGLEHTGFRCVISQ